MNVAGTRLQHSATESMLLVLAAWDSKRISAVFSEPGLGVVLPVIRAACGALLMVDALPFMTKLSRDYGGAYDVRRHAAVLANGCSGVGHSKCLL